MTLELEDAIDVANAKPLTEFLQAYLPAISPQQTWTHPASQESYQLSCQSAPNLTSTDLNSCFELIRYTSQEDYKKSKDGWKPRAKKKEMQLLDLKYLLVRKEEAGEVLGFVSFMPTYEDDFPVIYVYEIHLSEALRGTGLGRKFMMLVEIVASKVPTVEKIMLTCFLRNRSALAFYEKLGYAKDQYSPPPKQLRNGALVEADYVILSKPVASTE